MIDVIVILTLIIINGFFALSEIALVSSKRMRLEERQRQGSKGAGIALKLQENSENFLSAIQVGITLIGIVTGVYSGTNIAEDISPFFGAIGFSDDYAYSASLAVTIAVITYISIVIGELVPKTVALSNPEKTACIIAPFVRVFLILFSPVVKLLSFSTNIINSIMGITPPSDHITESELRHIIKTASHTGVIEKEQNFIHEKVFSFSDKKAKHLITHRTDVEWIDLASDKDEIDKAITAFKHTRVICCDGELDKFKGILDTVDYFRLKNESKDVSIINLMQKPVIIPENADAQQILSHIRKNRSHMVVVVNEFGGFEGIITVHDILENLLGHLPDSADVDEPHYKKTSAYTYTVNGDAPIETISEIIPGFSIDFENINYSTVAGFVIDKMGKIPEAGETITLPGYAIKVTKVDGTRLEQISITTG
ncbi:MAG: HlyC/CorC family transporter [Fibrobacteres bacterium]|nr:HlyC/CorC family transporter [Fibrobacterota bacterium]